MPANVYIIRNVIICAYGHGAPLLPCIVKMPFKYINQTNSTLRELTSWLYEHRARVIAGRYVEASVREAQHIQYRDDAAIHMCKDDVSESLRREQYHFSIADL